MGSEMRARLGLWFLLVVALMTFNQVFESGDFPGPAMLGMLAATAIVVGLRRLRAGSILTTLASAAGLAAYLCLVFQADDTFYGLPTTAALEGVGRAVTRALEHSQVDYAPVPIRPGYAILIVAALWVATHIGELATFQWKRPLIASLIPMVLFAVALIVGTGIGAPMLLIGFLAALLTYWGLESAHRVRSWGRWVSAWSHVRDSEPQSITGPLARKIGAGAIACALVAPAFMPAIENSLLSWRTGLGEGGSDLIGGRGGDGSVLRSYASIVPRLIEQSDQELFRVEADNAQYWRTASLEVYEDNVWIEGDVDRLPAVEGAVETRFMPEDPTRTGSLVQRIEITGLGGSTIPAAENPMFIARTEDGERAGGEFAYEPNDGILFLVDDELERAETYEVVSAPLQVRFAALSEAEPGGLIDEVYTQDPGLSPEVQGLVSRWIADANTPFEELLAIQSRLRGFEYTLNPDQLDQADYLTDFLLNVREGYCQQFATAFALVARHLGYPSRVSVGFLPGDVELDGTYVVRGNQAHAWPEVYFDGFGWVRFEPTPRSETVAPSYTTSPLGGGNGSIPDFQNPLSDVNPRGELTEVGGGNNPDLPVDNPREQGAPGGGGNDAAENQRWQETFSSLVRVSLIAALLFLIGVPFLKELRTRRRYAGASSPRDETEAAFVQLQEDALQMAEARHPAESALAYARRLARLGRVDQRAVERLAELYEQAIYSPATVTQAQAGEAKRLAQRMRAQLWKKASFTQRAERLFSPRVLLRQAPGGGSRRAAVSATAAP